MEWTRPATCLAGCETHVPARALGTLAVSPFDLARLCSSLAENLHVPARLHNSLTEILQYELAQADTVR